MKKILLIPLAVFVLSSSVIASDFRDVSWGMSTEDVARKEKKEDFTKRIFERHGRPVTELGFEEKLSGISVRLIYVFVGEEDQKEDEGKLVQSYYMSSYAIGDKKDISQESYVKDFDAIYRLLLKKYGKPEKDEKDWSQIWGHDDDCEHVTWKTSRTKVVLELTRVQKLSVKNRLFNIKIIYTSKKLGHLLDAPIETEKATLKKL